MMRTDGAARIGRKARHGEERLQRVADARAAVPIADDLRRARERLLAPLEPHRRVTRVSRVPKVNVSTRGAAWRQRMSETEIVVGARLHRAGDVDQQQQSCAAASAA